MSLSWACCLATLIAVPCKEKHVAWLHVQGGRIDRGRSLSAIGHHALYIMIGFHGYALRPEQVAVHYHQVVVLSFAKMADQDAFSIGLYGMNGRGE